MMMVIVIIIVLLAIYFISVSNKINNYKVTIEESKSTVDIALGKRYDVISELCAAVKKYTAHEQDIMNKLISVRQGGSVQDTNEIIDNQNQILRQIYAVGESYPELLSSNLYVQLQKQIAEQNEYLAASKRTVNSNISMLNHLIVSFPSSVVAKMKGVNQLDFLKEETKELKKEISVNDML